MDGLPDEIRVLHVDDEPGFSETAAEFLQRQDDRIAVVTATSPNEGLDHLGDDFHCIVSDYDMPDGDGIEFLETVRETYPDIPFILFTGKGSEEIASEAISAGVSDYLQKSPGTEQYELLANRITNQIAQTRAEAEAQRHHDRFQILFENFPEPTIGYVYRHDEPYVSQVNAAFTDVFGYTAEEAVGEPIDDLIVPPDRADEADRIDRRVESGEAVDEILRRRTRDGLRDFWFRNVRLPDDVGLDGFGIYADVTERRARERTLERQNELFRKAQDIANVGAWEYDVEADVLTWTEEVYAIHDLPTEFEPTPQSAIEFYHPEDRDRIRAAFDRAVSDGDSYDVQLRLVTAADEVRWVRTRGDPTVEDGSTVCVRGTIQDVTDQKASAERIRALADSFPDLAFIIDETGRYVEDLTGPVTDELYVTSAESKVGGTLADDMSAQQADALLDVIQRALETDEPQSVEYRLQDETGTRWFEARTAPLQIHVGGNRAVTWVAREVTDRRERERVLKELHAIATELPTYQRPVEICERTVDAAESVLEFDNCLVFLAEGDELKVMARSDEFPADEFGSLPIDDSLAGLTYRTGESYIVGDAATHPVANPQGPYASGISVPLGDHGVCQMIAETEGAFDDQDLELAELLVAHTAQALDRLTREADLRERNRRLDEFASVVSHDLRNPLRVAEMGLELVTEECDSDELPKVVNAVDRSLDLIDDLLTVARGSDPIDEVEPVDLPAVMDECWQTVETASATLQIETARRIQADSGRLKQLLENLIGNAVAHGGGDVTVTLGELDDGFYVADDGPGIPADLRDRVLEPGYSTDDDGIGFGLYIIHEIATAHGWDVRLTEGAAGGARCEITGVELAQ